MTNPLLSIIVPVYNVEKCLNKCIDSILAQTYKNFELILIDDGSTDKSGVICDVYSNLDKRIIVLHKENGGVSTARNIGLDIAKGDYITFADSDDFVHKEWLENYISVLNNEDIVIQGFIGIEGKKETKSYIPTSNSITREQIIIELITNDVYGYSVVKLFKNSIIKEHHIRFDINSNFREDEQFVSEFFLYVKNIVISEKWGYYYVLPSSDKKYKGNPYYSLLYIFKCLDNIYHYDLPESIVRKHYINIKDYIVVSILGKKKVDKYIIDLYSRMSKTMDRKKIIDIILSHPNNLFVYLLIKLSFLLKFV